MSRFSSACNPLGWFAVLMVVVLAGCTSLPDAGPFAVATGELSEAVRTSGRAASDELRRMTNGDAVASRLDTAWEARKAAMTSMVAYADALRAIVESAHNAGNAGRNLAEKLGNLATAAGIINPAAGASVKVSAEIAGRVWGQIALARASASLAQALDEAQPAVETIAETIAADTRDLRLAVDAALQNEIAQIRQLPGANDIIGFHENVAGLKGAILSADADLGALTREQQAQLDAIDRQLASTRGDYERFQSLTTEARERHRALRALLDATGDAVARWGAAHKRLAQAVRERKAVTVDSLLGAVSDVRELVRKVRDL